MYHKIMWFYVFVLTLLDISLNTKLTAFGKSHGVTVHDSLIEGITFQEWGKEQPSNTGGAPLPEDALKLSPSSLSFGRAQLASAHAMTVTLTNTGNSTLHLASVAGTTHDFHASFFESKTLAPQANTTFSVVYLGRREGPVSAHLYIHTSRGVHKYPVSAVGVASEWGVWPLVGIRIPANATLQPVLTMYNPTDQTIQVEEVYSSASWVGLQLPSDTSDAPRALWTLPPRSSRPIVRLSLRAHKHAPTAYIRIKGNMTCGDLVVAVETQCVPAGEYCEPEQLRAGTRGANDPPTQFDVEMGNSAVTPVLIEGSVWGARCASHPVAPLDLPSSVSTNPITANGGTINGWEATAGAQLTLLRAQLDARQDLTRAAKFTLQYSKLWAGYGSSSDATSEAYCAGWVRLGKASLPYSVHLLPGTLKLLPEVLDLVTAVREDTLRARELQARNDFMWPLRVTDIEYGPDVHTHFDVSGWSPLLLRAGETVTLLRLKLRQFTPDLSLNSWLKIRTNVTHYTVPLRIYSGTVTMEWDWPKSTEGFLDLGVVGLGASFSVPFKIDNPGPAKLCLVELSTLLSGGRMLLDKCGEINKLGADDECRCIDGESYVKGSLEVAAPNRNNIVQGTVTVRTAHAQISTRVQLSAHAGDVWTQPLHLYNTAPYAWSPTPVTVESTMSLTMKLLNVSQPPVENNPALVFIASESKSEIISGSNTVGEVAYKPEVICAPHCYAGLEAGTTEETDWLSRNEGSETSLRGDAELMRERHALYTQQADTSLNVSLRLHTDHMVQIPALGTVSWWWPRLTSNGDGLWAGLAGIGATGNVRLVLRNPCYNNSLLIQPVLLHTLPVAALAGSAESPLCKSEKCIWSRDAFTFGGWRAVSGYTRIFILDETEDRDGKGNKRNHVMPMLLLSPKAEIEISISFAPNVSSLFTSYLYLRNNLTIVEGLQIVGRGALPRFELGGKRPGLREAISLQVTECGSTNSGSTIRRMITARNSGSVPLQLHDWKLAGAGCEARGFRIHPCIGVTLAPNESRTIEVAFTPDFTLSKVKCPLRVMVGNTPAEFLLKATTPAKLLPVCSIGSPRAPFESALRAMGALLCIVCVVLALAAAAVDAERMLRRARLAHSHNHIVNAQPLDLRNEARAAQPVVQPNPPPRRRKPARRGPTLESDPQAERRAFELWRAEVLRRDNTGQGDDSSRSSEDADTASLIQPDPPEPAVEYKQEDTQEYEPEEQPRSSGDDDVSTGSEESSPRDERDYEEEVEVCDVKDTHVDSVENPPRTENIRTDIPSGDSVRTRSRREHVNTNVVSAVTNTSDAKRERRADSNVQGDHGKVQLQNTSSTTRGTVSHKTHTRKETSRNSRRKERAAPAPPRVSPALNEQHRNTGSSSGNVRVGASWSSVVACKNAAPPPPAAGPPPLAPIGSDVRRREEADHSLFFFNGQSNGTETQPEFAWRPERSYAQPASNYLNVTDDTGNLGGYTSFNSMWCGSEQPPVTTQPWVWGFNNPSTNYNAASTNYNAPSTNYNVPSTNYNAPSTNYNAASTNYNAPSTNYNAPSTSYNAPSTSYNAPSTSSFTPSTVNYTSSSGTYAGNNDNVRPPPGFGPRVSANPPVRTFDPFHSLASIWAPGGGALDWRTDEQKHNEQRN